MTSVHLSTTSPRFNEHWCQLKLQLRNPCSTPVPTKLLSGRILGVLERLERPEYRGNIWTAGHTLTSPNARLRVLAVLGALGILRVFELQPMLRILGTLARLEHSDHSEALEHSKSLEPLPVLLTRSRIGPLHVKRSTTTWLIFRKPFAPK